MFSASACACFLQNRFNDHIFVLLVHSLLTLLTGLDSKPMLPTFRSTGSSKLGSRDVPIRLRCINVSDSPILIPPVLSKITHSYNRYICTKAREEEQRTAQAIIKKFPERNVRLAQKRAAEREAAAAAASGSLVSSSTGTPPNEMPLDRPAESRETANKASSGSEAPTANSASSSSSSWWPSWGSK